MPYKKLFEECDRIPKDTTLSPCTKAEQLEVKKVELQQIRNTYAWTGFKIFRPTTAYAQPQFDIEDKIEQIEPVIGHLTKKCEEYRGHQKNLEAHLAGVSQCEAAMKRLRM